MAVDYKRLKMKKTAGFLNYTYFGEQSEGRREREREREREKGETVDQLYFVGLIKIAGFHRMLPNVCLLCILPFKSLGLVICLKCLMLTKAIFIGSKKTLTS